VIELRDIGFRYDGSARAVLERVDLPVEEGELVLVSGRTGAGKSTLLGVVTGLVPRFTGGTLWGDVLVDGESVVRRPPRERADVVGYVGQDPAAGFVTDTVEEELAYGMEQLGLPSATMRRRVEETLDLLGIADLRARDLRSLSGGEQQRVAIGSVLTMHTRVLVLDEPSWALDPTAAEEVLGAGAGRALRRPDGTAARQRHAAHRDSHRGARHLARRTPDRGARPVDGVVAAAHDGPRRASPGP
jgi:energy-coupling factor transporter ATP-binding protein EcfA2